MDIKEIAELVSKKIYVEDGLLLSKFISEKFAEALVSELAKQNEPVAFTNSAQLGYVTSGQHQDIPLAMWSRNTSYSGADIPLYTYPPTAEQIANETAWQPIETAPKDGRELILLLTPSNWPQVAYSNTWWQGGFSVENKPTHWMPLPKPPAMAQLRKDRSNGHQ